MHNPIVHYAYNELCVELAKIVINRENRKPHRL